MKLAKLTVLAVAAGSIAACTPTLSPLRGNADRYIAVADDRGFDRGSNAQDVAGIAVTPDGCQAWVIDDGAEGRASNRLDPVSGLPVCQGQPGVVYGPYRSGGVGIGDWGPRRPANVSVQTVPTR